MSVVESIESGVLPTEVREALRALLSQQDQPYLDIPGDDGLGICISPCLADFRRHVEAEYEKKLKSSPKVPTNYRLGARRKLPDGKVTFRDVATQTEPAPRTWTQRATPALGTPRGTAQTESAPEAGTRRRLGGRRRVVCSSSSETDHGGDARSPQQSHPQGGSPLRATDCGTKRDQHRVRRVRGRGSCGGLGALSMGPRILWADGYQRSGRRVRPSHVFLSGRRREEG